MKKSGKFVALAAVALMLITTACDKVGNIKIPFGAEKFTFVLPASEAIGEVNLAENTLKANLDSIIASKGGDKNNIKGIKISGIKLTMLDSDESVNMSILQSIKATIAKESATPETVGELKDNPDVNESTIVIPGNSSANLAPYLDGTNNIFKVSAVTRKPIARAVTVEVTAEMEIEVGLAE